MKRVVSILALCGFFAGCQVYPGSTAKVTADPVNSWDRWAESNPSWVKAVTPHRIIDNVYYVGSEGLGSYLIATDDGHILLDGGLPQNAAMIVKSIATLGFDIRDVKVLINSHAHFDHSGGLAELKSLSGAPLIATQEDRSSLEGGFYLGDEDNADYFAPAVEVDQIIGERGTITIGGTVLTANLTPGHSRGCTTWTLTAQEDGRDYDVLFFCSASVAGNRLEPPQYEGVVEDYRKTFAKTRNWRPDIPLSNHPNYYFKQLDKFKAAEQEGGPSGGLAFVDRQSFPATMAKLEKSFVKSLAEQRDYTSKVESYRFDTSRLTDNARYLFYLHGKIVEDQGLTAVSAKFGEYQYVDILERWQQDGFVVFSEPREANVDVKNYARRIANEVETLLARGVLAENITVVGASKGAYIASLVSHYLQNDNLNTVLLASCSQGVVAHMLDNGVDLYGQILTVRDASDTHAAGSCQAVFDASDGLKNYQERVLHTGLSHGVIYRPLDDWWVPVVEWIKR